MNQKRGKEMQLPEWVKPALGGAAGGAIALAILGFSMGGWVTAGTAQTMATTAANQAVVAALVPHCLAQAQSDPQASVVLAELKEARAMNRRTVIEKAGWATPINEERPNRALAQACQEALST